MLLVILIGIFAATVVGYINIGWLLVISIGLFLYTIMIHTSKREVLTDFGKLILVISIVGIAYCVCVLTGINIMSLF